MRMRMAAIGASVALAIGGLAACSGGGQDVVRSGAGGAVAAADPAEALKQAAQNTTEAGTAKVSMAFSLTGVPGIDNASFTMDGAVDATKQQSSFSLDLSQLTAALPSSAQTGVSAILGDGKMQIVTDGGDLYLQLGSLSSLLGAATGQSWLKIPVDGDAADAVGAPLGDGTEILKLLDQAGGLKVVGTEQVRGVDTTHTRARSTWPAPSPRSAPTSGPRPSRSWARSASIRRWPASRSTSGSGPTGSCAGCRSACRGCSPPRRARRPRAASVAR